MHRKISILILALLVIAAAVFGLHRVTAQSKDGAQKESAQNGAPEQAPSAGKGPAAGGHPGKGDAGKGPAGRNPMAQMATVVVLGNVDTTLPVITRKYTGVIEPIEMVKSIARVSGKIVKIAFKEGEIVKKGDLLFEIEPDDYEDNVDAAQAAVESAQATIREYEAKIRQIDAQIVYKEAVYKRYDDLYHNRNGAASLDSFENAASDLEATKAQKAGAEASLKVAQAGLKSAQSTLSLKKLELSRTKIYAEITGKTGRLAYTLGNYVTPTSEPLITVTQLDPIYIRVAMSESDFTTMRTDIKKGDSFSIRIMLANGTYYDQTGTISFSDNEVDTGTDTIILWAKISNTQGILNPGGVVKVFLDLQDNEKKLSVPISAVMHDPKGEFVWAIDKEGKPIKRRVVLGPETGDLQCIVSGLQKGERIVIDGGHKVMEGVPVMDEADMAKAAQQGGAPGTPPATGKVSETAPAAGSAPGTGNPSESVAPNPNNEMPAKSDENPVSAPMTNSQSAPGNTPVSTPAMENGQSQAPALSTKPAVAENPEK